MNAFKILVIGNNKWAVSLYEFLNDLSITVRIQDPSLSLNIEQFSDFIFLQVDSIEELHSDSLNVLRYWQGQEKIITINIDGDKLLDIQSHCNLDLLGMNVSYPMKSSLFLEIIKSNRNSKAQVDSLYEFSCNVLKLDPYICENISIRAFLLAAMAREAFYLVDNGYADPESIDRACRNDAGYYLPFTGNFLYMDLMGTMAYSLVMKDLNPELSKEDKLPDWFIEKIRNGHCGMDDNVGIHIYTAQDKTKWEVLVDEFTEEIGSIIHKYKKDYLNL